MLLQDLSGHGAGERWRTGQRSTSALSLFPVAPPGVAWCLQSGFDSIVKGDPSRASHAILEEQTGQLFEASHYTFSFNEIDASGHVAKNSFLTSCNLMYSHVITEGGYVPKQTRGNAKVPSRRGTPLTVYFSDEQTIQLNNISRQRRVPKAELLRIAVDLLVNQLNDGQLQLPLGVDIQTTMPEFRRSK